MEGPAVYDVTSLGGYLHVIGDGIVLISDIALEFTKISKSGSTYFAPTLGVGSG